MKMKAVSSVYETEPMYIKDQRWFLNCVVSVDTALSPEDLLTRLKTIESHLGRQPSVRYGPRTIDLDILFYGSSVVSIPGLEIPHPKIAERAFVLAPLEEIRPALVHPLLGKTVSELARGQVVDKKVLRRPGLLDDLVPG